MQRRTRGKKKKSAGNKTNNHLNTSEWAPRFGLLLKLLQTHTPPVTKAGAGKVCSPPLQTAGHHGVFNEGVCRFACMCFEQLSQLASESVRVWLGEWQRG